MPTRDTPWPAGTPCWVDYGAPDMEAAKRFYTAILGWDYDAGAPEFGGYTTCLAKGLPAAGMGPQMDPSEAPSWTTYFSTEDAEATVARITEAGGTVVVPPMEVGPMGTMVIALDPEGSLFGLWQSGEHTGERIFNEPGSVVWNEAAVEDPAAAQDFYAAVFGFTFTEVDGGEGYRTFATDEHPLGGLGGQTPGAPSGWSTCFAVSSTDEAVEAVEKNGGKVTMPAEDTPFGRFAVVQDPWGAAFSVMQDTTG